MDSRVRAIIIGGGIAGKLAARVLSDFYKEVIILERDSESTGPKPRKGTPQGHHLHALLHAGEYGLEALYPGISETFHNSGALKIDSTKDLAWFHHGVWKHRYSGEFTTTLQTRPHLEWHLEQYTRKIPNVTILNNKRVKSYLYDKDMNKTYGVTVIHSGITERLVGDLIVDTSGVSSFSSKWLKENQIFIPEEKVHIGLSYISRFYHLPDVKNRDWTIKLLYPNPPYEKIGGSISKIDILLH